mmetsp:Transcript_8937/g.26839  ORF Transcript_8937/g.26839 Transcript_8937/m.26839 type:complete len:317 (-) Transcript_8937:147-1097(-)
MQRRMTRAGNRNVMRTMPGRQSVEEEEDMGLESQAAFSEQQKRLAGIMDRLKDFAQNLLETKKDDMEQLRNQIREERFPKVDRKRRFEQFQERTSGRQGGRPKASPGRRFSNSESSVVKNEVERQMMQEMAKMMKKLEDDARARRKMEANDVCGTATSAYSREDESAVNKTVNFAGDWRASEGRFGEHLADEPKESGNDLGLATESDGGQEAGSGRLGPHSPSEMADPARLPGFEAASPALGDPTPLPTDWGSDMQGTNIFEFAGHEYGVAPEDPPLQGGQWDESPLGETTPLDVSPMTMSEKTFYPEAFSPLNLE